MTRDIKELRTLAGLSGACVVAAGLGTFDWRLGVTTVGVFLLVGSIVGMINVNAG